MADPDQEARVLDWLSKEGYPLEYYAASVFRSVGLPVKQGMYTRSTDSLKPREIDLVVEANFRDHDRILRIETIVECKWSGNKPLVVFTSSQAKVLTSACICHTISSDIADDALWLCRDDQRIADLTTFMTPELPGIGGRQAFGNVDKLYNALLSVTAYCAAEVNRADQGQENVRFVQNFGIIALPLIVVEGSIYEARYDDKNEKLNIAKVQHSRCHWRGSPDWPLITHVDIVSREHLHSFAQQRAKDCVVLGPILLEKLKELDTAFEDEDGAILVKGKGPTGRGNGPRLLWELSKIVAEKRRKYLASHEI